MASMRGLFAKQRKICYIPSLGILKCHSSFVILCSWSSSLFGLVSLYAHICLITYTPFVSGNMGESHGRPRKVLIELRLIHRSPVFFVVPECPGDLAENLTSLSPAPLSPQRRGSFDGISGKTKEDLTKTENDSQKPSLS